MKEKPIAIFGCGALGSALAGLLSRAGRQVLAVVRSPEQAKAIRSQGLLLLEGEQQTRVPLETFPQLPEGLDCALLLVLVKSCDTPAVAEAISQRLPATAPVLTLQNGWGNAEALSACLRPQQVLAGATTFGALLESPGVVRLTGRGACEIGAWHPSAEPHLRAVAALLSGSGIPCSAAADVRTVLWRKLAVNAVINPLTAILRVPNGELLQRRELEPLLAALVEEVCRVAAATGVSLPSAEKVIAEVRGVCHTTAANRSSMLRDIEQGRRTEVAAINGAVVRLGREHGVPAPANLALAALVEAMSVAKATA